VEIACNFKTIRMNHNLIMLPSPPVDWMRYLARKTSLEGGT
jgi:hypothetical protein